MFFLFDVRCIHYRNREIAPLHHLSVQRLHADMRGEDPGTSLAAEEDHPLIEHAQAFHLHRTGGTAVGAEDNTVEIPQINRVEAAVEHHRFHVNVGIQQLSPAALYRLGAGNDLLRSCSGVKAQVLHAILVAAGIIDLSCMDTNGLAVTVGYRAGNNTFRHMEPPKK